MIFDIVVLSVIFLSAVIAVLRGFIREVLTIMGVVGGGLAAFAFGGMLSPTMLQWIGGDEVPEGKDAPEKIFGVLPPELMADILAYGAVFAVVVIVLSVVSHFLAGGAKKIGLGAVDRSFGAVFGIVRGAVVLVLLYLPLLLIFDAETRSAWFAGSKTHHFVESGAAWTAKMMPEYDPEELKEKVQKEAGDRSRRAVVEDARTRLLQLDELRPAPADEPAADDGTGYEVEQRRDLNELIMENAQ